MKLGAKTWNGSAGYFILDTEGSRLSGAGLTLDRPIEERARLGRTMSFQAYLDKVEELTGKKPNDFIAMAREKGLTEHKDIIAWLKADYGLGLGHARAIAHVILHGPQFTVRQTTGPHRDESDTLELDGKASR